MELLQAKGMSLPKEFSVQAPIRFIGTESIYFVLCPDSNDQPTKSIKSCSFTDS